MAKTNSSVESGADERRLLISVRVTPRESALVEALVRQQRCSRSQAVRWLAFFGSPPTVPTLNQRAFEELDEIRTRLVDLELADSGQPAFIVSALARVERALDRLRSALLTTP